MAFKIRKGLMSDIDKLFEINKECLPIYYSKVEHFVYLVSNKHFVMVAEKDKKVVGYVIGEFNDNKNCHIYSIGVTQAFRSNGIGTLFINKIVSEYSDKCDNITLYVHVENVKGIKFYEKNGFANVEHLPNYYGNLKAKSRDAYKMQKTIN
jgi:ribosomal-protein-alanine N-acetyltransferase